MNFDFSDGQELIPPQALLRGPDVLRPGSANARHGSGRQAFFYTKYPNDDGKRLHVFDASSGHEKFITDPEILQGFFGPELEKIKPSISYTQSIYGDRDPVTGSIPEIGKKLSYDHWEVRRLAMKDNLIGRLGYIKNHEVLMLWGIPQVDGWQMLREVIDLLQVSNDARICNGSQELGPVWKFKEIFDGLGDSKKKLTVNQDMDRITALARYHVATGDEKIALQKKYKFGQSGGIPYPDTSKMTPDEIANYPWQRNHWRTKIKAAGLPDPFKIGESLSFSEWLKENP
jgi:hypothetical protein